MFCSTNKEVYLYIYIYRRAQEMQRITKDGYQNGSYAHSPDTQNLKIYTV